MATLGCHGPTPSLHSRVTLGRSAGLLVGSHSSVLCAINGARMDLPRHAMAIAILGSPNDAEGHLHSIAVERCECARANLSDRAAVGGCSQHNLLFKRNRIGCSTSGHADSGGAGSYAQRVFDLLAPYPLSDKKTNKGIPSRRGINRRNHFGLDGDLCLMVSVDNTLLGKREDRRRNSPPYPEDNPKPFYPSVPGSRK